MTEEEKDFVLSVQRKVLTAGMHPFDFDYFFTDLSMEDADRYWEIFEREWPEFDGEFNRNFQLAV